ncbi:unnamed protein product [Ectocarpus sp. CCAP 1310/34]|nr:unnamed protein product [Ectocarpus sp. CCAP 1310/34]
MEEADMRLMSQLLLKLSQRDLAGKATACLLGCC